MSSPRSPSSPPPPPPNHPSLHARPPCPPRQQSSSRAPSSSKGVNEKESRVINKLAREAKKKEKEAVLHSKRQERIRKAFSTHQSSGTGRRDAIEIIVSPTLFNDTSKHDVLKSVRVSFPGQIFPVEENMTNLIKWKRAKGTDPPSANAQIPPAHNTGTSNQTEEVPMCVFVFRAEQYLMHFNRNTLNDCASDVKSRCLPTHRIVFAICGMDREVRRRTRCDVRNGVDTFIVDKKAIQDSYVHLYMEYGIRTHDVRDIDDLALYIRDVTEAIAVAPYREDDDIVSASLSLRRRRANAAYRTAVVSAPAENAANDGGGVQGEGSDGEDFFFGFDAKKKSSMVRIEGLHDLGNLYLTMLCLIPGVTIKKAQCIRDKFPTLRVLLDAYDECASAQNRDLLLSELRYGDQNRRLGPALSKSVAVVLTSVQGDTPV